MPHSVVNDPTGIIIDVRAPCAGTITVPFRKGLLTLRLPENPTTGHVWQPGEGTPGVSFLGERRESCLTPQGRIGAGRSRALVFRVQAPGRVRLNLARPWESAPAIVLDVALED